MERTAGFCALVLWASLGMADLLVLQVHAVDDFAHMIDFLKTFQVHACDGEVMRIRCHNSTVISLNFVQYGRPSGQSSDQCMERQGIPPAASGTADCVSKNAIKVVEKNCQEHTECGFMVSPSTFQDDPCPRVRKYAEVAYKCRPYQFENRIACEDDEMILKCPNPLRIFIYSAYFGNVKDGAVECPETLGYDGKACDSSYATQEVIRRCFGTDHCSLKANTETFGIPLDCAPSTRKFLKVVFTCVPQEALQESKITQNISYPNEGHIYSPWIPEHELSREKPYQPEGTAPGLEMQQDSTNRPNRSDGEDRKMLHFFTAWLSAHKFMEKNKHKLILYVSLTLCVGVMFFVVVAWLNCFLQSNFAVKKEKASDPPITDDDFFSESDLEHFEGDDFISSANNTMMRKISETIPRAPVSDGPQTNHFFS